MLRLKPSVVILLFVFAGTPDSSAGLCNDAYANLVTKSRQSYFLNAAQNSKETFELRRSQAQAAGDQPMLDFLASVEKALSIELVEKQDGANVLTLLQFNDGSGYLAKKTTTVPSNAAPGLYETAQPAMLGGSKTFTFVGSNPNADFFVRVSKQPPNVKLFFIPRDTGSKLPAAPKFLAPKEPFWEGGLPQKKLPTL